MRNKECKDYLDEVLDNNYYEKKMVDNNSEYCKISDLAKRFIEADKKYGHSDWNLAQILANIRMIEYYTFDEVNK